MTISLHVPHKMHNRGRRNSQKQTITGFFGKQWRRWLCVHLEISEISWNRKKLWLRIASDYYFATINARQRKIRGIPRRDLSWVSCQDQRGWSKVAILGFFSRFSSEFRNDRGKNLIFVTIHVDTWCYAILAGESEHRRDIVNIKSWKSQRTRDESPIVFIIRSATSPSDDFSRNIWQQFWCSLFVGGAHARRKVSSLPIDKVFG